MPEPVEHQVYGAYQGSLIESTSFFTKLLQNVDDLFCI